MNKHSQDSESQSEGWTILVLKTRVDSFTQHELVRDLKIILATDSRNVAIDLRSNRFLSVQAIRTISEAARRVAAKEGQFILIGCSERTKRHFASYGSLENITIARTERDLPQPIATVDELSFKENSPEAS